MTAAKKLAEIKAPGKFRMTMDEYHAHPAIGSSALKQVLRSPAHYLYDKQNPSEPTPAMKFGQDCHEAILEPKLFKESALVMPKFEGAGSRSAKDQWLSANHGRRVLKEEDIAAINEMIRSVGAHPASSKLLTSGVPEESYFVEIEGVLCKARPDFLRDGHIIVDIKTTTDASPREFARSIANYKYHLSAALYLDVVGAIVGKKFDEFVIVAVEKAAPYAVAVYLLDEQSIAVGRHLYKQALGILKNCLENNSFPAYSPEIQSLALPSWAFPAEEAS